MVMGSQRWGTTTLDSISYGRENIFRAALRLIEHGLVEIAQGIRLIAEGTLRPVRGFVPSLVALLAIATVTTVTLVVVVIAVAQGGAAGSGDAEALWSRWNQSPEMHFGDTVGLNASFEAALQSEAAGSEWAGDAAGTSLNTAYVAASPSDQ